MARVWSSSNFVWPAQFLLKELKDEALVKQHLEIVEWFSSLGQVVKRLNPESGWPPPYYNNTPFVYCVDGILCRFLPHWEFYFVEDLKFRLPTCKEDILKVVQAVQGLVELGCSPR